MRPKELGHFRAQLLRMKASLAEVAGAVEESTRIVELDQAKVGRLPGSLNELSKSRLKSRFLPPRMCRMQPV